MKASARRLARVKISLPRQTSLPNELGKLISRYATPVAKLGWEDFLKHRRGRGNFSRLGAFQHPARRLLRQYKHQGAPVVLAE